jgi:hypothetical protein
MNAVTKQLGWQIVWQTNGSYDRIERLGRAEFNQQEQGEEMPIRIEFLTILDVLNGPLDQLHKSHSDAVPMPLRCPNRLNGQFAERRVNLTNDLIQLSVQEFFRRSSFGTHASPPILGKSSGSGDRPDILAEWQRMDMATRAKADRRHSPPTALTPEFRNSEQPHRPTQRS